MSLGQDTAAEIQERVSDPLGVGAWWDKYKVYVLFAAGGVVGWTLCSLISSPTVVIRPTETAGLGRKRRR